jgi:4'-phosphopantetheinyl transferase
MSISPSATGRLPTITSPSVGWTEGPAAPEFDAGAVHVWRANLTLVGDGPLELLSAAESERAAGMLRGDDRLMWSRSRGVLRALLGRYVGQEASAVALAYGAHGKPIPAETDRRLFFNLSHSCNLALYAFTATGPVGVDVQVARRRKGGARTDYVALARRALGDDAARRLAELSTDSREEEFLRLWTRHEAELKRRGLGIGGATQAHPGAPVTGSSAVAVAPHASPWIVELDVGPRAAAALALRSRAAEPQRWRYAS